jgi:hypothetical protein
MSENEETVEGLCDYHQYAREFIDLAHGRRKEITAPDPLEGWHYYAWRGRTIICDECDGTTPLFITWDTTMADAGIRPWYWWAWELKRIRGDVENHELDPVDANPWPDRLAWAKQLLREARSDGDSDGAGEPSNYYGIKIEIADERAWALLANPDLYIHGVALNIEELFTSGEAYQATVSTFGIADIEKMTEADLKHLDIDGADHE